MDVGRDSASTSSIRDPPEIGLDLGDACRRGGFALARVAQTPARRFDRLGELPVLAREERLFPPPELVAQLLIPPRPARLPLQRAALFLDLEHDVIDARQVQLRRFELQLRRPAAGLVVGDAGGFLDQLAAVGRTRAQNEPDLALLDDRVRLGAQARIHQQIVDVAQTAHLTVDQVFAVARAIQPPRDFDLARDRLDDFLGAQLRRRELHRQAGRTIGVAMPMAVSVAVPVAVVPVAVVTIALVAVPAFSGKRRPDDILQHSTEAQPDLGGRGRFARVAAVEDHVFHALAAQALRALLAHHPGDGVGDVALAASVRADDGRHALVEGELRAVGKRFEPLISRRSRRMTHTPASRSMPAIGLGIWLAGRQADPSPRPGSA